MWTGLCGLVLLDIWMSGKESEKIKYLKRVKCQNLELETVKIIIYSATQQLPDVLL